MGCSNRLATLFRLSGEQLVSNRQNNEASILASADPPAQLRLDSWDLVVLPTVGFFEWENVEGEQFGLEHMEEVIRASRQLAPAEIIAQLYDAVTKFSNGTKQQDDLTAVIIKRM